MASVLADWEKVSGHRPLITVEMGDRLPPQRTASFPAGLSGGREIRVSIDFKPAAQWAAFESRARAAVMSAYRELSRNYYKLAASHRRAALLSTRQKSLEKLREESRLASNAGDASWTEVVYLDSLVDAVESARAANRLETEVLAWGFRGSPLAPLLRSGKALVWSQGDFCNFYAKMPPLHEGGRSSSPEDLAAQFGCLMALKESVVNRQAMSALYDQVRSELLGSDVEMAAAEEVLAASKSKEVDARLAYVESILSLGPPVSVDIAKIPSTISTSAPAPSPAASGCGGSEGSGAKAKVAGVLLLAAGIVFLLWTSVRKSVAPDAASRGGGRDGE